MRTLFTQWWSWLKLNMVNIYGIFVWNIQQKESAHFKVSVSINFTETTNGVLNWKLIRILEKNLLAPQLLHLSKDSWSKIPSMKHSRTHRVVTTTTYLSEIPWIRIIKWLLRTTGWGNNHKVIFFFEEESNSCHN